MCLKIDVSFIKLITLRSHKDAGKTLTTQFYYQEKKQTIHLYDSFCVLRGKEAIYTRKISLYIVVGRFVSRLELLNAYNVSKILNFFGTVVEYYPLSLHKEIWENDFHIMTLTNFQGNFLCILLHIFLFISCFLILVAKHLKGSNLTVCAVYSSCTTSIQIYGHLVPWTLSFSLSLTINAINTRQLKFHDRRT